MSIIWRARDELLDRMVAIKVLASELAADARFRALVREEARAAAQLVHPHVTAVHDYGELVGSDNSITAFVVMELLYGQELESRLATGALPWPEAVEVCAQVAEALAAAHRLGIVHRDVTPANIMLTDNGAKVLDFGIATHVGAPDEDEDGDTFGTPAYVAPERLDGVPTQPATDIYSLGVLLFEALTGRVPFPAETWDDLALTRPGGTMPPLVVSGLPAAVVDICQSCLSRAPEDRPTARDIGVTLREQLVAADPSAGMSPPRMAVPAQPYAGDAAPVASVALAASGVGAAGGTGTATLVGGHEPFPALGYAGAVGLASALVSAPATDTPTVVPHGGGAGPGGTASGWAVDTWSDGGWTAHVGLTDRLTIRQPASPETGTDPLPPIGPGGPDTPAGPGDAGAPGWRTAPRGPGWSPLRTGMAATGSVAALATALLIGLSLGDTNDVPSAPPQSLPAPQTVPTPGPATPATAVPGRSGSLANPPGNGPATQATGPVLTVKQAINAVGDVIDQAILAGQIRRDAGLDLAQTVNNLRLGIANGEVDVDNAVELLRQKVDIRANEGAIRPPYVARLRTALDRLAAAR